MSEEYQVPKSEVPARALLPDGSRKDVHLYLSERAERHSGPERPSDLLNGDELFVPVRFADTGFALLQRTSVLVVAVRAGDELRPGAGEGAGLVETGDPPEGAERREVRVVLDQGTEVEGTITYVMPPGERRLQDFLNQTDDFVRVRDDDRIKLVNTRRIVRIEPL